MLIASAVGQTGSGNVLLAGQGTSGLADISWDSLTLAKSGGTFTFQDTVQGQQLLVLPGAYQVHLLDGGVITQAVNFQNTGGVVLGNQDSDVLTFTGGLTSIAGLTTLQGTIATAGTNITLGSTTLVSTVTLATSGGDVSVGPIQGAGVPLTVNAGTGDVSLADPNNVIGDLTIAAHAVNLAENDNVTQGGAWNTTGPTVIRSGPFAIVLTHPANQFGPLSLTGGNIAIVESGDTELTAVAWAGVLTIDTSGNLLVNGPITGSGAAQLAADGNVTFATGASLVSPSAANVTIVAGSAIELPNGALIDAGAGTIGLTAAGNIALGRLLTTNSTAAAVSITSTGGSVVDVGDSGGPNIVAEGLGAVVSINAAQTVGSAASPLDLAVRHLVVSSGGDQHLSELDDLSSLNLSAAIATIYFTAGGQIHDADGAVDIAAAGLAIAAAGAGTGANPLQTAIGGLEAAVGLGGLFLSDVGDLSLGGVSSDRTGVESSGGNIKIIATGSILASEGVRVALGGAIELLAAGDITLEALVASASGNITLAAAHDILATSIAVLETGTGTILLLADSDHLGGGTIQFAGNVEVGSGQVIFELSDSDGLLSGTVIGSGGLVKQGPGTLTIAPTSINIYTGPTQLLAGTLRVDGAIGAAGAAGTFSLAGGTTLTGGGDVNAPIFASATSARIVSLGDLALGDNSAQGFDFAGTMLVAGGDNLTLRDADLARLGILTSIAGGGQLTAQGGVEVGSDERLAGFGSVIGNVVVLAGGTVTPGASPGIVTIASGNVVLFADAIYLVEVGGTLAGSQHDQINVLGSVDVSGAVLNFTGGLFKPPAGTIFTLIANDDAGGIADPVTGQFRGLSQGATVRFGGIEGTISYVGGTGNDITLTVTDNIKIIRAPTPAPDVVAVVRNETGGGGAAAFSQRAEAAPVIVFETARPVAVSQSTDMRPQTLDTRSVERMRVFLMVVDEVTGQEEGQAVNLDPKVIDDVLGFFQRYRFPNGRYRIYLQEAGKSPRVIIEISIRDGRAVSPETVPAPKQPAFQEPAFQDPAPPAPAAQPAPAKAAAEPDKAADEPTMPPKGAAADPATQAIDVSSPVDGAVYSSTSLHRWSAAAASLSASLALATAAPRWRDRVRQFLADPRQLPRTRFHCNLVPHSPENLSPPT